MLTSNRCPLAVVGFGLIGLHGPPAEGQLFVYEGFQYDNLGAELIGLPDDPGVGDTDATGLDGVWADASASTGTVNDMFIKSGSLVFSDLQTAGNHIGFSSNQNRDRYSRPLSASALAGIGSANEIWFSFLFEKLQNNFNAGEGGVVIGNQVVANSEIVKNNNDGAAGGSGLVGFGIAPTGAGNDLTAYAWDGTTNVMVGDATLSAPPANGNSNTDASNLGDVKLLVGHIAFNAGTGGTDQFTFYNVTDDGSLDTGDLVQVASTIEIDVDESLLTTLNVTRQVNLNYDEIRIAGSLEEALGLAGGAIPGDTDNDGDIDDTDLGTSFSNYTGPLAPGTGGK
ncbi:MAG: hypothetical protein ACE37H_13315, partial [Phycisphaeraceae bacterium]